MPSRNPHQKLDMDYVGLIIESIKKENRMNGYVIQPKGLNIIWGNDLRYWKKTTEICAELLQVSWLEVSGKVAVEKGETYMVKFDVEVKKSGFGWENTPVFVMATIGRKGPYEYKKVNLDCVKPLTIPADDNKLLIKVGPQENDPVLHFGLYEIWSGKWKGGLIIKKAEVVKFNPSN